MKKFFILSIIAGSIVTLPCAGKEKGMVKIEAKEYGDVSGKVIDKETGAPIPAVSIWVHDRYGDIIAVDRTDMDGKFSMEYQPLQVGDYYFRVPSDRWGTKGKYLCQYYDGASSWRDAVLVEVEKGKTLNNIDFYLERGATLSGTVTCEGKPVVEDSVEITVYDAHKRRSEIEFRTVTDSTGRYTITGVPPRNCKVHVNPRHYIGICYGQTERFDSASVIAVRNAKDIVSDIDVSVRRGGKISGHAFLETTKEPVPNIIVRCIGGASFTTDSNGYFEFAGLDTGEYTLMTNVRYRTESSYANQYYKSAATREEADLIEIIPGQEISDIKIYVREGGRIPISVLDRNGFPVKRLSISLVSKSAEQSGMSWGISGNTFQYPNIFPGKHAVQVSYSGETNTGNSYAKAYYEDASKLKDATFIDVQAGYKSDPITIVMKPGGWVRGFMKHNGNPIDGDTTSFTILAYDAKTGDLVGTGYTGHHKFCGGYKVSSLPLGKHKFAALNNSSYFSIEYYGGGTSFDDPKSTVVKVKEGKPEFDTDFNVTTATCEISGEVIDVTKNRVPRLSVSVCAYDKTGHIVQVAGVNKGKYHLKNLRPGKYAIRTRSRKGYKDRWYGDVDLPEPDDPDNKHFFVKIPNGAKQVALSEGQHVSDIDFSLDRLH
jgi:protocatechuate 3,4-dioxygenase beta subunit